MRFWKMHGAGNDFIIVNNMEARLPHSLFPKVATTLCRRRLSIGADGFMVIERARVGADFKMLFFNADGSEGEMCGNGTRCICRYGYEMGLCGETQTIETKAGVIIGKRVTERLYRIRLQNPSVLQLQETISVGRTKHKLSYVELGKPGIPHVVLRLPELETIPEDELRALGRAIRHHEHFPKGTNVNFYTTIKNGEILEKTYERGAEDFTLACGAGTAATVVVMTLLGEVSGRNVHVNMAGGELIVDVEQQDGEIREIYLTGPTNLVAAGVVQDEDLSFPHMSS